MLLIQHNQEGVTRRLSVIGIPRYTIKPFVAELVKWESCSGVEWTIKRLKSLKVDLIRSRTGLEPLTWVRKNRKGKIAGTIGSLFKWASLSERNFGRCVQAFMAYSHYILPSLTETQKNKFLSAINPVKQDDGLTKQEHKLFSDTVRRTIRRRIIDCVGNPLVVYQGSPDKKAPRHFGQRSVPQDKRILDELQYFNCPGGLNLYHDFKELYSPLLSGVEVRQYLDDSLSVWEGNPHSPLSNQDYPVRGGEIHFLQEPGGKLRSVASPFRIHQEALRPLGQAIYGVVRSLPWDCTFDQSKAFPHIQSRLVQGGQISSVDLSNATDYFPLSLQETALRAIFHRRYWNHIDLFIKISRGTWSSALGDLRWTKGQPLGLYPSFGAFTLTHGLLLLHLVGGVYRNQFYVVGDDVVILEDKLHNDYITMLDRMGCPWSTDKSIVSNKLCEFAGKIVTSDRVIPQLKWRKMSDDNFLDICRLLGNKSRCLLNERQKRVFDKVAELCAPIGLEFNPKGKSLEDRVKETLDFYRPDEVVLGALMGLRRRINSLVYSSIEGPYKFNSFELENLSTTFDQKVKSALSKTVFSNWRTSVSIGLEGLSTLPEALGLTPRLPLQVREPTRITTLERYERLLKH